MNNEQVRGGRVESGVQTAKQDTKPKYCAKCQNHVILELVKGHKRHCNFKFCTCVKCLYTDMKRKNVATKVQLQRELKQEQEKAERLKKELKRKLDDRVKSDAQNSVMPKPASSPVNQHQTPTAPTKVSGDDRLSPRSAWKATHAALYDESTAMVEFGNISPVRMYQSAVKPSFGYHYQWGPTYCQAFADNRPVDAAFPHTFYPPLDPFSFHLPLRGIPYGFAHTLPSTSYTLPPPHQPARSGPLTYEDYHKFTTNRATSPLCIHNDQPSPPPHLRQVEI